MSPSPKKQPLSISETLAKIKTDKPITSLSSEESQEIRLLSDLLTNPETHIQKRDLLSGLILMGLIQSGQDQLLGSIGKDPVEILPPLSVLYADSLIQSLSKPK